MSKQLEPIVVNEAKELDVPTFNKKEIEKIAKDVDEAGDYSEVVPIVNKAIANGDIDIESIIEADKNILSKIKVEYDENHDRTVITFPRNILPITYYSQSFSVSLFFDYYNSRIIDENGNIRGTIEFADNIVDVHFTNTFTLDLENDSVEYILCDRGATIDWYSILNSKLESITDKDGHKRFVEQDINIEEITGISKIYGKWSLSGSHLLIVICVSIADGTAISSNTKITEFTIPRWIYEKIYPLLSNEVSRKTEYAFSSGGGTQSLDCYLRKRSTTNKLLITTGSLTLTADRVLRISYDLLIDNE